MCYIFCICLFSRMFHDPSVAVWFILVPHKHSEVVCWKPTVSELIQNLRSSSLQMMEMSMSVLSKGTFVLFWLSDHRESGPQTADRRTSVPLQETDHRRSFWPSGSWRLAGGWTACPDWQWRLLETAAGRPSAPARHSGGPGAF